ncbi:hypothetical protein IP68_12325 [Blastomonas sp. AAP25]|uniref:hypothetical protein n=1 Tax=Blastomonas sp. AAP25 TaxID=1523416 RepID=UPI0006B94ADC|nr:hypothetical protein [Blastomonas sp. AAP25]KPF74548.1 hypothetical protein IP68_12325 [Blastomonas sp. AAP25]
MTRLFRLLFTRRVSASDAARTLSTMAAAQRAEQCVTERQAVRAKALEIAERMGRRDLVERF